MAVNNRALGTTANPPADPRTSTRNLLGELVDHNTREEEFQEGIFDLATQVDQTQIDVGYNSDLTTRVNKQARTVDARLNTVESLLGVSNDDQGTQDPSASAGFDIGNTDVGVSPISGTLADPAINAMGITNTHLANNAVTSSKIMDGTVVSADLAPDAGVTRTQLEMDLQTYQITTGTDQAAAVNLGANITIPLFDQDQDGVVDGPTNMEVTPGTGGNDALYVLGSDNNWHQLNTFARHGNTVPAAEIASSTTGHTTTAAVPVGTTVATFLAAGANRLEGSPATQYGLEVGDYINFTNTTPTPDEQTAFVYIGAILAAGADGDPADFVPLGQAENFGFASGGAIEFEPGTRNLRLASSIQGDRTFSNNVTTTGSHTVTGNLIANGNVDLGNAAADTVSVNGNVDTDILPAATDTHDLGSSTARWQEGHFNNLTAASLTASISDTQIAAAALSPNRISATGATEGQVLTRNAAGSTAFVDPPIGIQMVTTLTIGAMGGPENVSVGTVVSLVQADGTNAAGVYRAVTATGSPATAATWQRLGTVNVIMSKTRVTSTAGTTTYTPGGTIPGAHLVTVDGLTLVEGVDYSVNTGRTGIVLTAAVAAGKDIEFIRFADVASLGAGEVDPTALAPGALPTGVTVAGGQVTSVVNQASSAAAATSSTFQIGNWTIVQNASGGLDFNIGADTLFRLETDGHLHADNDITAFSSTI